MKAHVRVLLALAALLSSFSALSAAHAFCGFYVAGNDATLVNNATMVSLMRGGTRTVLSMRNSYEGPPEDFALVLPVPEILDEESVVTLPDDVFDRLDGMGAPRLVEYWEQDPCAPEYDYGHMPRMRASGAAPMPMAEAEEAADMGVTVEAEFSVDEYDIVILSAREANGLERWLRTNDYNIPAGAAPYLRPYIEAGIYFFVARVDIERVTFSDEGRAQLSPLRFHYEEQDFSLPIRLGLINADGPQDLIVNILAEDQRYEVANYPNAVIPTNLDVTDDTRNHFGEFYAALFDRTLEQNPGAVVTEYSWNAATCDPCPGETLTPTDFEYLGRDIISGEGASPREWRSAMRSARFRAGSGDDPKLYEEDVRRGESLWRTCAVQHLDHDEHRELNAQVTTIHTSDGVEVEVDSPHEAFNACVASAIESQSTRRPQQDRVRGEFTVATASIPAPRRGFQRNNLVLTRLHMRYDENGLDDDLVFRPAAPIVGGREFMHSGQLETGYRPGSTNNFQARYAIRHLWEGPITCSNPRRGRWGGPPNGRQPQPATASDLAFAPRGERTLSSFLRSEIPEP